MSPESAAPSPASRIPGLDAARALAVVAMVVGHTADGLLDDAARLLPWVQTYWQFRGLTAPLFLFVSGWAVMASMSRSKATGWALVRERAGRVLLLVAIGMLLRWPGWNLSGLFSLQPDVVAHFVGFDALHCIALSLLLGALVFAVTDNYWGRAALALGGAVLIPIVSGALVAFAQDLSLPVVFRSALVADAASPFPLLPWAGYFFAGAAVGQLLTMLPSQAVRALALFGVGFGMALAAYALGLSNLPLTSPVLFLWRVGQVLVIASAAMVLPVHAASWLAPLGRSTLVIYVFHLPVVYGWSTVQGLNVRYGRSLSPGAVILLAVCLIGLGLLLAEGIRYVKGLLRSRQELRAEAA